MKGRENTAKEETSAENAPIIRLKNIDKAFAKSEHTETYLFQNFSLDIMRGSFVSVVGSNGSGKTTLLNLICGSLLPDRGTIEIGGANVTKQKEFIRYKKIGRVYQNPSLGSCAEMTVAENLALADNKNKPYNLTFALDRKKTMGYAEAVSALGLGLENKLGVKMGALSGGQRQALSLLMATMSPVDILVLDEHTAALDPKTADLIMRLTDKIVKEKRLTALMVTHNLRYAVEYGDRMLMMHEGKIIFDKQDEEKKQTTVPHVLGLFNAISVECGN